MKMPATALFAGIAFATMAACSPTLQSDLAAPHHAAVGFGEVVKVGSGTIAPKTLVEDSRCPATAACVWEGRLVITAEVERGGSRETGELTLGKTATIAGQPVLFYDAAPEAKEGGTDRDAYRFTFTGGQPETQ